MNGISQESVLGLPFVVSDLEGASAHFIARATTADRPLLVAHSDVHVLTRALHEDDYGEGLRRFDYICPDGMPIVWLLRRKDASASRLYGPDMMEWMWDRGRVAGLRHFLLGGSPEAQELLRKRLGERFPGVNVVGGYSPPMGEWPEGEDEKMIRLVRESGANCVWVGLGCPKQECWLFTHKEQLPPALYFGVGAAFNFHAGLVKQAPPWIRAHGLEWLYRFCREPRRLFKRYCVHNTMFLWYCCTRKI